LKLALIAAVARNRAIGKGNDLLWKSSTDQQFFKRTTMGCPVIMGRKTWDSLPERFRPLPGRRNIVVTRNAAWSASGAEVVHSLAAAVEKVRGETTVFVMGGAQIYAEALPMADELVLTEVDASFDDADAFFPAWHPEEFIEVSREMHTSEPYNFAFVTYERRRWVRQE
jgi:dihydrofolate reductase